MFPKELFFPPHCVWGYSSAPSPAVNLALGAFLTPGAWSQKGSSTAVHSCWSKCDVGSSPVSSGMPSSGIPSSFAEDSWLSEGCRGINVSLCTQLQDCQVNSFPFGRANLIFRVTSPMGLFSLKTKNLIYQIISTKCWPLYLFIMLWAGDCVLNEP